MARVLYTKELLYPQQKGYHLTDHESVVANMKRVLEYYTMDAEFINAWKSDPGKALKAIGIDLDPKRIRRLLDSAYAEDAITEEVKYYREFIENKLKSRCYMQQVGCIPDNPAFAKWRDRQVKRCWVEMGMRNQSLIHAPLMFELSDGCSVGCPFCGLNAGKLNRVYRYTPENAALFKNILHYMKGLLGKSAGSGTCYYATEPLDNPDYEKFIEDYYEIFGIVPQTTTAAAMRNPKRTKMMLASFLQKYHNVHRFSVLSLDTFHQIMDYFTPEELLYVELLPQFAEAPSNHFSKVGRNRISNGDREDYNISTICCISGFVINMARREIRLVSPCGVDGLHSTGERIFDVRKFRDFEDFQIAIQEIIQRRMCGMNYEGNITFYPYLDIYNLERGIKAVSKSGYENQFIEMEFVEQDIFQLTAELIRKGGMNANDIAEILESQYHIDLAYSYLVLGKLFQAGFLDIPEKVT